jgi:chromate transporter
MIGTNSLHIYIIILLSLLWFRNKGMFLIICSIKYTKKKFNNRGEFLILDLSLTFYKIGTLIFGGTPIALPFMYAEIKNYEYMKLSEDAFWIGFALSAAIVFYFIY